VPVTPPAPGPEGVLLVSQATTHKPNAINADPIRTVFMCALLSVVSWQLRFAMNA
jgi:hypothetical protein